MAVGAGVAVGVAAAVGSGVDMLVGTGVGVGVGCGVAVAVAAGVVVGVSVGCDVAPGVATAAGFGVGVGVATGTGVSAGAMVAVGCGSAATLTVAAGVAAAVGVAGVVVATAGAACSPPQAARAMTTVRQSIKTVETSPFPVGLTQNAFMAPFSTPGTVASMIRPAYPPGVRFESGGLPRPCRQACDSVSAGGVCCRSPANSASTGPTGPRPRHSWRAGSVESPGYVDRSEQLLYEPQNQRLDPRRNYPAGAPRARGATPSPCVVAPRLPSAPLARVMALRQWAQRQPAEPAPDSRPPGNVPRRTLHPSGLPGHRRRIAGT